MTPRRLPPPARLARTSQGGVVLLFALISLLVLMIGATAMIRSFNTSLFMAGNIGFKRDLQNQGERAVTQLTTHFQPTGALGTRTLRKSDQPLLNYSAQMLQTNAQGVPVVLTLASASPTDPTTGLQLQAAELTSETDSTIRIRYVIDRLCAASGDEKALGTASCAVASTPSKSTSGSTQQSAEGQSVNTAKGQVTAVPQSVLYRLSVRVTGPRNTQSFFQSTFTVTS